MLNVLSITVIIWAIEVSSCYNFRLSVWHGWTVPIAVSCLVIVIFASILPLSRSAVGSMEVIGRLLFIYACMAPHLVLAVAPLPHAD